MSETTFFEITFPTGSGYAITDRHEIEDALHEALQQAELGEVSGGGAGMGKANIDVEITDPILGLALIRRILHTFSLPANAVIRQNGDPSIHHSIDVPHT